MFGKPSSSTPLRCGKEMETEVQPTPPVDSPATSEVNTSSNMMQVLEEPLISFVIKPANAKTEDRGMMTMDLKLSGDFALVYEKCATELGYDMNDIFLVVEKKCQWKEKEENC